MIGIACLAAASVGALLLSEWSGRRAGVWVAKPLASATIVGLAVQQGALDSVYGRWVLAALLLSFSGDVLLIPKAKRSFALGLLAFLAAHVAYGFGFLERGVEPAALLGAALLAVPSAGFTLRYLQPHLRGPLRIGIPAYVLAIASMAVLAAGAAARNGAPLLFAGAALFCASDLAVARERFVKTGFINKSWGLPFYFLGQGLLAASVAATSAP